MISAQEVSAPRPILSETTVAGHSTPERKTSRSLLQIGAFLLLLIGWISGLGYALAKLIVGKYPRAVAGEVLGLAGVLTAFLIIRLKWDGVSLRQTVLYPAKLDGGKFLAGVLLGSTLIGITYLLARFSGAIRVSYDHFNLGYVVLLLTTMLLTATWEETAFRGLILPKLADCTGKNAACVVVALAFGLMHLLSPVKSVAMVLSTTAAGLLLNYAFLETSSIFFPIGIHFGWNFFNSLLYPKSTVYLVPWLAGRDSPEEGIFAIALTIGGFLAVIAWSRLRRPSTIR